MSNEPGTRSQRGLVLGDMHDGQLLKLTNVLHMIRRCREHDKIEGLRTRSIDPAL